MVSTLFDELIGGSIDGCLVEWLAGDTVIESGRLTLGKVLLYQLYPRTVRGVKGIATVLGIVLVEAADMIGSFEITIET